MVDIAAPVFKSRVDALAAADLVQTAGTLQKHILPGALTDHNQGFLAVVHGHIGVIGRHVVQVKHRAVVVHQIIAVVAEEFLVVIQAGNGEAAVEEIRAAVIEVRRVHGAHGAAEGHNALVIAVALAGQMPDIGHQFVHNIVKPALVVFDAPAVVRTHGCPGLIVDGVGAVHGALAGLDPGGPGFRHVVPLKIEEPPALAGKKQYRLAIGAIDLELHIPVQIGAVVLEITYFHLITPFS